MKKTLLIIISIAVLVIVIVGVGFFSAVLSSTPYTGHTYSPPAETEDRTYHEGVLEYRIYENAAYVIGCTSAPNGKLVIPSELGGYPVTAINSNAFQGSTFIRSIEIAEGITSIGACAFYGCTNLESITFPKSLTEVNPTAFDNSGIYENPENWEDGVLYIDDVLIKAKQSIKNSCAIKEGTRLIASWAFEECDNLTSVKIPQSVETVGFRAFSGCNELKSVELYSGTTIGHVAFRDCNKLTKICFHGDLAEYIKNEGVFSDGNIMFIVFDKWSSYLGEALIIAALGTIAVMCLKSAPQPEAFCEKDSEPQKQTKENAETS